MVARKKTSTKRLLNVGTKVVLNELPPGLLDGLPEGDQRAIRSIVGVPVRLSGSGHGRLELEFVEPNGDTHLIYVARRYVSLASQAFRKRTKRRK